MMIFALQPLALGAWLPQIPDVQMRLGMGPAALSLGAAGISGRAALTALPFGGRIGAALGGRRLILWGLPAYLALMTPPPHLRQTRLLLFAALALAGASIALVELGLNLTADEIEKSGGRLIMSACHGYWSVGIMAGSLAGAGLAMLALPPYAAVGLWRLSACPSGWRLRAGCL